MDSIDHSRIRGVRTLGPAGTNLEAAAKWWCQARSARNAQVVLHDTLERAVQEMTLDGTEVLIGCIVYPDLHTLVFGNLAKLEISECFVFPTHRMVLASRDGRFPLSVATHPAPRLLVPQGVDATIVVTSNSAAAMECARGAVEGCVTTIVAAQTHGLKVLRDYGSVPMGFSVHCARGNPASSIQ
jgi:hypothetical protein